MVLGWFRDESLLRIPGVVYYTERSDVKVEERKYQGFLFNIRLDTAPRQLVESSGPTGAKPGPEEVPYTWAERIGIVPIHPSRVRARQFYHPTTNFSLYDYDDISPEEKELTAKWMSRALEYNMAIPTLFMCVSGILCVPLQQKFRMPLLMAFAATGVIGEALRANIAASKERQDLDDFQLTKEIWYIKNVETYQLGLPRMKRGTEHEFHTWVEKNEAAKSAGISGNADSLRKFLSL